MPYALPFNPRNRKVQLGVGTILVLLLLAFATKCHSAEPPPAYVQFGVGSTVVRGATAVIDLSVQYPERVSDAGYEFGATFIGESSFREQGQRNNFALHAALIDGFGRFDVGLGAAYLQNVDEYNGSHLNFQLILQYRVKTIPLTFRVQHFSNGGTQAPNRGRDMLLAYWRF